MKKILFYLRALNIGGAETFIYNVLEKLDTNLYHIDIVLQSEKNENIRLLELCKEKKVKIFLQSHLKSIISSPIHNYCQL